MQDFIRNRYRHWIDHSTGLGMVARRLRRIAHERANKPVRLGNVAMLHAGRCGSTVLGDMLRQHPEVNWAGEIFENMKPAYYRMDSARRAESLIANRMYRVRAKYFGFETKYLPEQHLNPQLADRSPAGYVGLLRRLGFGHFILLDRHNQLKRAVSVAIGTRTGKWTSGDPTGEGETPVVRLDPDRFVSYNTERRLVEYFALLRDTYAALRELLAGERLLELVYETDVELDPSIGYRKICAFLGIEPRPASVRLKKQNRRTVAESVSNFDEVQTALAGTEFEWMLHE